MPHTERIFCDGCGYPSDHIAPKSDGVVPDSWRRLRVHQEHVALFFCPPCIDKVMRQVVAWAVPPPKDEPNPENWPSWKAPPGWAQSDEAKAWFHRIMAI